MLDTPRTKRSKKAVFEPLPKQDECKIEKEKQTWCLHSFNEVPPYLQINEFIKTGYRKHLSYSWCVRSLFKVHNETGNVWTHLISFLIFIGLSIYTVGYRMESAPLSHRMIFLVFLLSAQQCFLCSSLYHLLLCHSEKTLIRMTRMDYSGISSLISGSFYPAIFYGFYCFPFYQYLYLTGISMLGLVGMVGPLFDFFHEPWFNPFRIILFAGSAGTGIIPVLHHRFFLPKMEDVPAMLDLAGHITEDDVHNGILWMYLLYGLGLVCYITKFPECYFPGKFDYWFSSHQLWHVFVFAATYVHFGNCLNIYLRWKSSGDCPAVFQYPT